MRVPCSFARCGNRRIHHERPNEMRGTQMVDVPDDHPIDKPAYCSMTCAISDGAMSLKYEPPSIEELDRLKKSRFWKEPEQKDEQNTIQEHDASKAKV